MQQNHATNPHFVFIHGWGQSSKIWHRQSEVLTNQKKSFINLPGHGGATDIPEDQWFNQIGHLITQQSSTQPIVLIGWSLGGLIALKLQHMFAQHIPTQPIAGLVLISTTPRFRGTNDWDHGCSDEMWGDFIEGTTGQNPRFMQRFFQTMLHGDNLTRAEFTTLSRQSIDKAQPPSQIGLNSGLNLLSSLDVRDELQNIQPPTLIVHGQQDAIINVESSRFLNELTPQSQLQIFEDCGHAPFLTHHVAFNQTLERWWKNLSM